MIIQPDLGPATDLEQLTELAPPWVGIGLEAVPHPADERLTVIRYTITDYPAERSYVFQHSNHQILKGVVAGTVAVMREFGTDIMQIPHSLTLDLERLRGISSEPLCLVRLMDPVRNRCIHHFEDEEILEAFRGFWENLDSSTVARASTGLEPAMT